MSREPSHRYVDPLDEIWLTCAERVGLRVERAPDVYASTDGAGRLRLASHDLDPDDCVAQMIFHELCHSLIEGPESFARSDWGLDNESDRHVPREHACLRLQAHLAGGYGLRRALAPTTDFRDYYDALPDDPLTPRHLTETGEAVAAARRSDHPPWGPHLHEALAATAAVAAQVAPRARGDSLWTLIDPRPEAHPTGLRPRACGGVTCGDCAWHYRGGSGKPVDRCRQVDGARIDASWPACERFEAELDCQTCGACCRAAYHSVTISRRDPVVRAHPALVVDRGDYLEIRRVGDRCACLAGGESAAGGALDRYRCIIYQERPRPCREFERGGGHCVVARRRVGLSL